jgi:hypothetical protein
MKDMNVDEWPAFHETRMREVDALVKRANKRHESDPPDGKRLKDLSQAERDAIEKDVTAYVDEINLGPKDPNAPQFDTVRGWSLPADDYISPTYGSLKEILATLRKVDSSGVAAPDDFYYEVERVLNKYSVFIQHGIRENFGEHKGVSWYLVDTDDDRCVISYQEGHADWCDLCLADEAPLWLIIGLLRRIKSRKKLGDQETDETIAAVMSLDAEYIDAKRQPSKLNVLPHRRSDGDL